MRVAEQLIVKKTNASWRWRNPKSKYQKRQREKTDFLWLLLVDSEMTFSSSAYVLATHSPDS
jgi:hypothetical protein